MRVLFITTAHNGMSQRLKLELEERGHAVSVELALSDGLMHQAVGLFEPELVVAPMLTQRIPGDVWRRVPCLIVHPGIRGDRGMSSLDWAISEGEARWGVTILQAAEEMDAGDIWAWRSFPMRAATKSSIYNSEVVDAAAAALLEAVDAFGKPGFRPVPLQPDAPGIEGRLRPRMKQRDRQFAWNDASESIVRKVRAADGSPGVVTTLLGQELFVFDAHLEERLRGRPGTLLATRHGAVCVGTGDGALWIGHAKRRKQGARRFFKLPASRVLAPELARLEGSARPPELLTGLSPAEHCTWQDMRYQERGALGVLSFDFYNGAMATDQCMRLRDALAFAKRRATRVLMLCGGRDFWCNGIHLNRIEAAPDPAEESWRNIQAIDDVVLELLTCPDKLVVAALQGSAGAGGVTLALAADRVWARPGIILNPHHKSMGGLYGSEYWTYLLPRRVGRLAAELITESLEAMSARQAQDLGLIDDVFGTQREDFLERAIDKAERLGGRRHFDLLLTAKNEVRRRDEASKALHAYREEELARMRESFFGGDRAYHRARADFVYKRKPNRTPLHLALHRQKGTARAPTWARPTPENGEDQ